jgi:mono/diheme cytochrome c family protein
MSPLSNGATVLRFLAAFSLLAGIALTPAPAAELSIALTSPSVDLPDSDAMFPGGSGAEAANNNCLACHSADMVLNQPALSRDHWAAEVNKMISAYKAPVAPEDVGAIVDYLVSIKGEPAQR